MPDSGEFLAVVDSTVKAASFKAPRVSQPFNYSTPVLVKPIARKNHAPARVAGCSRLRTCRLRTLSNKPSFHTSIDRSRSSRTKQLALGGGWGVSVRRQNTLSRNLPKG